jgi:hypothetical protein
MRILLSAAVAALVISAALPSPSAAATISACDAAGELKSGSGSAASAFRITNGSSGPISIGWQDFDGNPVPLGGVGGNAETSFDSYATHAWILQTASGDCVCGIVLDGGDEQVSITSYGQCVSGPVVEQVSYEPTGSYEVQDIEGWKVLVSSEYSSKKAAPVLKVLKRELAELKDILSPGALRRAQSVPLWIDLATEAFPGAAYHPDAGWLRDNGMNPDKAGGVQISENLVAWIDSQPMMLLHEIAHALEHQVIGLGDPQLLAAYNAAKASGKYDSVRYVGGGRQTAYGMNNEREYFAELSEAYFGENDYYPFNRDDLREFDPEGYATIEALWARLD